MTRSNRIMTFVGVERDLRATLSRLSREKTSSHSFRIMAAMTGRCEILESRRR
jgi:hypothetical protein